MFVKIALEIFSKTFVFSCKYVSLKSNKTLKFADLLNFPFDRKMLGEKYMSVYNDKFYEQAGAELGQAQLKMELYIWLYFLSCNKMI